MPGDAAAPILITGANGHIGRRLIARLTRTGESPTRVRAIVRSRQAAALLEALPAGQRPEILLLDYSDPSALARAASGCWAAVHLVGILKESRAARYAETHEATCTALTQAAEQAGLRRIVYLSIVGSDAGSANSCLASRGRAEDILLRDTTPVTVLRVAMVIGPGDIAARALRGQALASLLPLVGGGRTLQQPIDVEDVVTAITACLHGDAAHDTRLDLAGPECLSHRDLVLRAASLYGRAPSILPIPLGLVRAAAALLERASANPPITPAMLGVLQHDDRVATTHTCKELGIELTPLDETLRRCVGPEAPE